MSKTFLKRRTLDRAMLFSIGLMLIGIGTAFAVPEGFNVQGRLTDSVGVNRNGQYGISFSIFGTAIGGTALWTKTFGSNTPINVTNGNFQVTLAYSDSSTPISSILASNTTPYLEIQVLSGPGVPSQGESPLVPRQQLVSVPFAAHAALADAVVNSGMPIGAIIAFAASTPPSGFLECNGASVLRSDYPALFSAIGTTWGAADSSHFNLPELRGVFPRGWNHGATGTTNDPDAAARISKLPGGASGDNVGSYQIDQVGGVFLTNTLNPAVGFASGFNSFSTQQIAIETQQSPSRIGTQEDRPRNAYVMYVIKY